MAGYRRKRTYYTHDELIRRTKVLLSNHYTEEELSNELGITIKDVRDILIEIRTEQMLLA